EDIIHEIVRGESLSLISRRFGVTLRELTEWNQLKGDTIFAGQELIVGRRKTDFQVYKVVRGDTLFSIASRFGLEVEEIARTNNMSVSSTLLTGMTLRIRSEE
ncbi:MAG TPA: LysM peptidoglycan-binding domain-containing protein, partial [Candidatus Latescibacteria bacterium]|nr:LysM peptidoglycan-binding domain-containing protein [Candidatus Latescibacterota bacterium]